MKILYLGNHLTKKSKYHSAYETLRLNLHKEGYQIITASSKINKLARALDMFYHVIKYRNEVSVILIDTFSTQAFYYAYINALLARFFKIKYIPILHGGNLPKRLISHPKLSKQLFGKAWINVAPSNYLKYYFENNGYSVQKISNSIDIDLFKFKERKQLAPNLLYARAFASIYNPLLAIHTLKELKKEYPQATLCMVGPDKDGTLEQVQQLIQSYQLGDSVTITGVLPKKEWHQLSEQYDIFINTTNVDNTPVSLIEAMALGIPVVSTNVGGIPHLITDEKEGLLVFPDRVVEMTFAVKKLLKNNELAHQMTLQARKKVAKMDWDVVKHKWIKILKDVV